jgi:hypothetical protein
VTKPTEKVEALMLDYYDQLRADLVLMEKFDPSKFIAAAQAGAAAAQGGGVAAPPPTHRFERAYVETKATADVYVTEGAISMQPQQIQMPQLPPGVQPPALPLAATFEVTRDEWENAA